MFEVGLLNLGRRFIFSLNHPLYSSVELKRNMFLINNNTNVVPISKLPRKGKGSFINRSIQSVGQLKALYTFCPPWQTCSFRHQLGFSGNHSSHAAITRNDKITHICTTVYSQVLIYTAKSTRASMERTKLPNNGIRTRAHLIASPAFYR